MGSLHHGGSAVDVIGQSGNRAIQDDTSPTVLEKAIEGAGDNASTFAAALGVTAGEIVGATNYSYFAEDDGSCSSYRGYPIFIDAAFAGGPVALAYARFDEPDQAKEYIHRHGAPIVIKADGLAGGKGVFVCRNENEAHAAIECRDDDGNVRHRRLRAPASTLTLVAVRLNGSLPHWRSLHLRSRLHQVAISGPKRANAHFPVVPLAGDLSTLSLNATTELVIPQ